MRPDGQTVDVHPALLRARIPEASHPTGNRLPSPIQLARRQRFGVGVSDINITHRQEAEALFVQVCSRIFDV